MTRSIPAVQHAIGGLYEEISGFSGFKILSRGHRSLPEQSFLAADLNIEKHLSIFEGVYRKSHTHGWIRLEKLVWKISGRARDGLKSGQL